MKKFAPVADRLSARSRIATLLFVLLVAAYVATFVSTGQMSIDDALGPAVRNSLPTVLLGLLADTLLRPYWPWVKGWRWLLLLPAAILFACLWYGATIVLIAAREGGWFSGGFTVEPFVSQVYEWFVFQGVTYFGMVAALSYAGHAHRRMVAALERDPVDLPASRAPILVRVDGEMRGVEPDDILLVSGAGDYVELVTRTETLLTGGTLAEYERRLPEEAFVRLHRSHLVRLGAIARAEPAGNGRTSVHLVNGTHLVSSRAGSARLRERSF